MNFALFKRFFAFGCVGGIGFIVDAGILYLLNKLFGVNLYASRALSFFPAVFVTWLLNRTFVFKEANGEMRNKKREYVSYLTVQTAGALINFSVFSAMVASFSFSHTYPILPLAIGSIVAMIWNYSGSHLWTFRPR